MSDVAIKEKIISFNRRAAISSILVGMLLGLIGKIDISTIFVIVVFIASVSVRHYFLIKELPISGVNHK